MLSTCLAAILDEAIEDGYIERNPARGRRMRVRVPKPARTFVEMDELVALTDAAGAHDAPLVHVARSRVADPSSSAAKVAELLGQGRRTSEIARQLGLAKSTVGWHIKRLGVEGPRSCGRRNARRRGSAGERAVRRAAARRAAARCGRRAPAHSRRKTEAGIREVQISPDLVEELIAHLDRLRRAGLPTDPDAFLFPNRRGGRTSRRRVWKIVHEAASLASERLVARGLPPLPNTTPHTLRRTYVSIALLANNFDVMWVMKQVGHADSKMTTDVYAQLQQRAQRQHGEASDALVRRAPLYGTGGDPGQAPESPAIRTRKGTRRSESRLEDVVGDWREEAERP